MIKWRNSDVPAERQVGSLQRGPLSFCSGIKYGRGRSIDIADSGKKGKTKRQRDKRITMNKDKFREING
jgi:hypothetical protein